MAIHFNTLGMSRTASEILSRNRGYGKPDVGSRPTIDDQINALREKSRRIQSTMNGLANVLRYSETFSKEAHDKFQKLNEELRTVKITEAEIVYLRNML
jgi:hypothetical protein